jgi:hypothetical protein
MAVLFDWNRTAAATAFDKQLLIAQGAASGDDDAARMVGKQVEEKKKNKKSRVKTIEGSVLASLGSWVAVRGRLGGRVILHEAHLTFLWKI